jgi:hypothetical protein
MICHSWKVMFHAEYSSGQPLKMLADLRIVVEEALGRSGDEARTSAQDSASTQEGGMARAAAAATFNNSSSSAPEFEVSSSHHASDDGDVI